MARFLTGLFGSSKQTSPPATSLRVNTSLQGVPIALHLGGLNRLAGNLIDYYNFNYQTAPSSGGGKGGIGSAGKGQSGNYAYFASFVIGICEGPVTEVTNGWVGGSPSSTVPPPGENTVFTLNGYFLQTENFIGSYTQAPWGYTESVQPSRALPYRGMCYAGFGNYPLGNSTSLPNFTFEVLGSNINALAGQPDGHASVAMTMLLTDPHFGIGFPASRLGSLSTWQSYCLALGMVVSPVIASSVASSSFINDLTAATNSAPCWQDGQLTVIPYGDSAVTAGQVQLITETHQVPPDQEGVDVLGNPIFFPQVQVSFFATFAGDAGVTYQSGGALTRVSEYAPTGYAGTGIPGPGQYFEQGGVYYFNPQDINQEVLISYDYAAAASYLPNTTPLYAFTLDDFMVNQGTIGTGLSVNNSPLICVRTARDQMLNTIKVEYLDRTNSYNPVDIEVKDEASIVAFGRIRPSDVKQFHFFCLAAAAQQSASLQLIRQQIARTYQWTCGRHFLLILELMALVTVTDEGQGLVEQPVRIIEIQENEDFSLTITAEEYLGTVSAPEYGAQTVTPFAINFEASPGAINAPIIFEPTDELNHTNSVGSLQIWAAVSGANVGIWGGCFVWASYDGENYKRLDGIIAGPSRMGVTTSVLDQVTANATGGPTIDTTELLSVNLAESGGTLSSGTQQDALALNTICYVGGEILAYQTATLTAANKYDLGYLVRGAYGTEDEIATWPVGTPFARLDENVFAFGFDQSRIGSKIYLKFQSFNIYQGGLQSLADCAAYPYQITGAALASPLPNIVNLRSVFDVNSGFTELDWDDITDFRSFKYEVRSGSSFASAVTLGQVAHPPFRVPGSGTYWVAAVSQPVPGLTVYSETWQSETISGAVLTQNVVLDIDLKANNWPGNFTGGAGLDSTLNAIRTGGDNILTDSSILATTDILDYGGGQSGSYYPSNIAFIDIGYVANASVSIKYQPTGVPVGQNVLTIGDILATPDILGSASSQFITVYPLINTATETGGDLYALDPSDLYSYPDLYEIGDYNWSGFRRFSPGTYQARALYFAVSLETADPQTIAYDLEFTITVTIPARVDNYAVTTSSSAATTITFQPTGASSPAPFNGGAGPSDLPTVQWGIVNAQQGDDLIITALSLSSITFEILNAGAKVVRSLSLSVEGF